MRREREFFQVAETLSQPFELRVPCVQTSRGFSTILQTVRFLQSCVEEHGVRVPARALEISLDPPRFGDVKGDREGSELLRGSQHICG